MEFNYFQSVSSSITNHDWAELSNLIKQITIKITIYVTTLSSCNTCSKCTPTNTKMYYAYSVNIKNNYLFNNPFDIYLVEEKSHEMNPLWIIFCKKSLISWKLINSQLNATQLKSDNDFWFKHHTNHKLNQKGEKVDLIIEEHQPFFIIYFIIFCP